VENTGVLISGNEMPEQTNYGRMIKLAEEFFDMKNDPSQITVDEETIALLKLIHPWALNEKQDPNGPVAWVLIFPTTEQLMKQFIDCRINEMQLLHSTPLNVKYDAVYLCSALVLPEYRGKGIARHLAVHAIQMMRSDHPISSLFLWAFSPEGAGLAQSIAEEIGLPLYQRPDRQ
jgi:GNAT superfamily N-acetyltransferase